MLYGLFLSIVVCITAHECSAKSIFSDIVTWLTKSRSKRQPVQQKKNISQTAPKNCNNIANAKRAIIVLHIFNKVQQKSNDVFFAIPKSDKSSQRPYHTKIMAPIVHDSGIIIVPKQAIQGSTDIFASFDETFDDVMRDNNNFRCQVLSIEGPFAILQIVNSTERKFTFLQIGSINDIMSANTSDSFYIINDKDVLSLNNLIIKNIDGIDYVSFTLHNYKVAPGSVIINQNGMLVGIFDAKSTALYNGSENLATDPNFIRSILHRFIKTQDGTNQDDFGLSVSDDFDMPPFSRVKTGAIVKEIKVGSAADRSKLEINDIIIACNGEQFDNALSLYNKLDRAKLSGYVTLTVLRNKIELTIELRV